MPSYHSLGIEVKLRTCTLPRLCKDPSKASESLTLVAESSPALGPAQPCAALHAGLAATNAGPGIESTEGCKESLEEIYFEEHRGILFLDDDEPPSSLVYAFEPGVDFKTAMSSKPRTQNMASFGRDGSQIIPVSPVDLPSPTVDRYQWPNTPDLLGPGLAAIKSLQYLNEHRDASSSVPEWLRSLSPQPELSRAILHLESNALNVDKTGGDYTTRTPHREFRSVDRHRAVPRFSDRGPAFKPLEVLVFLSESSFFRNLFQSTGERYDICISIFYNGRFANSQTVKYDLVLAQGFRQRLSFTCRPNEASLEMPWVTYSKDLNIGRYNNVGEERGTTLSASQQWGKISELLLTEADQWGKLTSGSRGIVGNYLECLSKQTIPNELIGTTGTGKEFGVVDVLIGYGRASSTWHTAPLASPSRRLPVGVKSTDVRQTSKSSVGSAGKLSDSLFTPTPAQHNSTTFTLALRPKQQDKPTTSHEVDKSRIIPFSSRSSSRAMPKAIPQKRYRGPSPEPDESSAANPKQAKLQDVLRTPTRGRAQGGQVTSLSTNTIAAASQTTQAHRSASTSIQSTDFELKDERVGLGERPDEETRILGNEGNVIPQAHKPVLNTLPRQCRGKFEIGPREMKRTFQSTIPDGVDSVLGHSLGRTRRATQDSKNAELAGKENQMAKRAQGSRIVAASAAPRYDNTSASVPETLQKIIILKYRSKSAEQTPRKIIKLKCWFNPAKQDQQNERQDLGAGNSATAVRSLVQTGEEGRGLADPEGDVTGPVYSAAPEESVENFKTEGILFGARFVVSGRK